MSLQLIVAVFPVEETSFYPVCQVFTFFQLFHYEIEENVKYFI